MPTFISQRGLLHPAKERVSLKYKGTKTIPKKDLPEGVTIAGEELNPGDDFLYNGPDREALRVIHGENPEGGTIGQDFKSDPDFIQMTRTRGYNSVDEYLKAIGYDEAKEDAKFKEKASVVKSHEVSKRVEELDVLGGGKDYTGSGNDVIGGFGEAQVRTPTKK